MAGPSSSAPSWLWAVLFLEFWKRTNTSLAHHWDCSEFEDIEVGLALCSTFQNCMDQSHRAPLMPFLLFLRNACGPSSQPWLL